MREEWQWIVAILLLVAVVWWLVRYTRKTLHRRKFDTPEAKNPPRKEEDDQV